MKCPIFNRTKFTGKYENSTIKVHNIKDDINFHRAIPDQGTFLFPLKQLYP